MCGINCISSQQALTFLIYTSLQQTSEIRGIFFHEEQQNADSNCKMEIVLTIHIHRIQNNMKASAVSENQNEKTNKECVKIMELGVIIK